MSSQKRDRVLFYSFFAVTMLVFTLHPSPAFADFESSLRNMKSQLSNVVLPLLAVIGLLIASFSYLTGNPNAKQHITYALIGAGVGFGAQAIIDFISNAVH